MPYIVELTIFYTSMYTYRHLLPCYLKKNVDSFLIKKWYFHENCNGFSECNFAHYIINVCCNCVSLPGEELQMSMQNKGCASVA